MCVLWVHTQALFKPDKRVAYAMIDNTKPEEGDRVAQALVYAFERKGMALDLLLVCMCVCVHICIYIYVYICVCVHVRVCESE